MLLLKVDLYWWFKANQKDQRLVKLKRIYESRVPWLVIRMYKSNIFLCLQSVKLTFVSYAFGSNQWLKLKLWISKITTLMFIQKILPNYSSNLNTYITLCPGSYGWKNIYSINYLFRHYGSNRAPLSLSFDTAWLKVNKGFTKELAAWMRKILLDHSDVYFVTHLQVRKKTAFLAWFSSWFWIDA